MPIPSNARCATSGQNKLITDLQEAEKIIESGREADGFKAIFAKELFRAKGYDTFEEYISDAWPQDVQAAKKLIESSRA